ncbi:MAG: hypothetical protein COW29_00110 [Rhodobacterales bacterium CG15_BIG_FIL_POST_REV_8_21_14_020_59_13]|nr:MAG: hypothetical protein COW29_00110 [Rhodobacterales bacterium CG15_BIG_FIL_POST_REV_8_21_14_020_59_13]
MTAELRPIERACPNCGANAPRDLGLGRTPWTIGECGACGFAYLTAAASYADLSDFYSWDKAIVLEAKRRKTAQPAVQWLDQKTRWRLHLFPRPETRTFLQALLPGGKVVDIGCGSGKQGLALPDLYTPFGVEISRSLAEEADAAFAVRGGSCRHAPSSEGLGQFDAYMFDGAMLNSYLEHETEPLAVLRALRRVLKPEGVAVVKVPNFASWNAALMKQNWCGIRLPDHVNYFTPSLLAAMSEAAGFTVDFPRLTNLPTNDNFWAFLRPAPVQA